MRKGQGTSLTSATLAPLDISLSEMHLCEEKGTMLPHTSGLCMCWAQ